ncbi:UDP-N-acetylglucosamine 1-carboxyvinyltransferase [Candidatus Parcubacteria bacterium]|nr:UDP-N-acetylglucosamine 1-carboxyvinyltransferase [Candidatus Parcubacteria bacterium]
MAERFVVEGLSGKKVLAGDISVRGAKNAVLKAFAAKVLFEDEMQLSNVPQIEDVARMQELLEGLKDGPVLKKDVAERIRASIVLTGPVLARYGSVSFPHPGGDVIGPRPINLFLEGFKAMGAEVSLEGDTYHIKAKKLKGAEIHFDPISVTATETLMMAAVLTEGETVLHNAAREPEISDLAIYLNECGAKIEGVGASTMRIRGGGLLKADGKIYQTPPDRIETGTFVLLGALVGKKIKVTGCVPEHVQALTDFLKQSGVQLQIGKDYVEVEGCESPEALAVETHEYPGFATDMQPPMMVYLTQAHGLSTLAETIWKGRLEYTKDLVRMGAKIDLIDSQHARIEGPTPLHAEELKSPDIRAGLAFLMAAAVARGTSTIDNVYHIDRGYERIEERLSNLGLNIKREQV